LYIDRNNSLNRNRARLSGMIYGAITPIMFARRSATQYPAGFASEEDFSACAHWLAEAPVIQKRSLSLLCSRAMFVFDVDPALHFKEPLQLPEISDETGRI
jgi:hypothetical protein